MALPPDRTVTRSGAGAPPAVRVRRTSPTARSVARGTATRDRRTPRTAGRAVRRFGRGSSSGRERTCARAGERDLGIIQFLRPGACGGASQGPVAGACVVAAPARLAGRTRVRQPPHRRPGRHGDGPPRHRAARRRRRRHAGGAGGRADHRPPAPRRTVYRVVGHPEDLTSVTRGRRGRGRRAHRLERPLRRPPASRQRARGAS